MGLTIHYDVEFDGTTKQLQKKLEKIRQSCLDLPFETVSEIKKVRITQKIIDAFEWLQALGMDRDEFLIRREPQKYIKQFNKILKMLNTSYEELKKVKEENTQCPEHISSVHLEIFNLFENILNDPRNLKHNEYLEIRDKTLEALGTSTWQMIQFGEFHQEDNRVWREQEPTTVVSFGVWAGEGCESTDFSFEKRGKKWVCSSFTKTQYAEEFVKCHLLVIRVLDLFVEQGFAAKVNDEGEYWETRDLSKLADNINEYTTMIQTMFSGLKKAAKKTDFEIEAPIENSKNYMKVDNGKG